MSFKTGLTKLLNIRTPILSGPMLGAATGILAAQVTIGGGLGFIPGTTVESFRAEIHDARRNFQSSGFQGPDESSLRIGAGFLGWRLDEPDGKIAASLDIALEERVTAVWLAFGDNLGKWVDVVRQYDNSRTLSHKTLIFICVNSVQEARVAVESWKADALIAQGIEAGGHGHGSAPPLFDLVPEILKEFPGGPPVVAAGGISTGSQVAALLTLGASGAVLGTRFLLSTESSYSQSQKEVLLAADGVSTIRTLAFDQIRGTTGWPAGVDGRGVRNAAVDNFENGMPLEEMREEFKRAANAQSKDGLIVWSGTGIGLIDEIKPAKDIVKALHDEAFRSLQAVNSFIAHS